MGQHRQRDVPVPAHVSADFVLVQAAFVLRGLALLPDRTPKRGGRWRDHRQVIDAIAFKYRTGTPSMDLPGHFGSWKGAHNRLRKWAADGIGEKVFTALLAQADAEGDLDRVVAVDSTIVRAHQHAAGARQKGPRPASRPTMPSDAPAAD